MGLLFFPSFASNTWRKPLQLIDCWLPEPQPQAALRALPATPAVRRFARAGWLHGESPAGAPQRRRDGRIALAGSADQICRELDRLVALEQTPPLSLLHRRAA
jgi:hypothetical protein